MADTSISYKCPNCTGPLSFQPGAEEVTCEFCNTTFPVQTVEEIFARSQEQAARAAEGKEAKWQTEAAGNEWSAEEAEAMQGFTCSSCGAEIVADGNTMATECAYCGNPTMLPHQFSEMLKPDFVIPFKKTKEDAVNALKKFYEGKWLLPSAFTANNRMQDIQPMYVPFWLFDSEVDISARFRAEIENEYESGDEIVTETKVYDCYRAGSMAFERIPVDGSEKMDDTYMESIEPFDYKDLVPFSSAYLTGYLAEKYDVDADASVPRADQRIETSATGMLEGTLEGYDHCSLNGEASIIKRGGEVKYAMVPVWILTTRYEGKPYTFMMNGQTGKVVGSLPIDQKKAWLYPLGAAIPTIPIVYFIAKFLGI